MNFFDLCVACGRAFVKACKFIGCVLAQMLRLTYRYWWIVLTVIVLAIAAALYYTRKGNIKYKVNAVALINGPSLQQFEKAYAPLQFGRTIDDAAAIKSFVAKRQVTRFETFHVIDCLDDGIADFIDFKRKTPATDTVNVVMQDHLCLQFCIKERDLEMLPQIEQALLDYLNGNAAMQQSYETYLKNKKEEVAFNHSQAQKLDSLTTQYYFHAHHGEQPVTGIGSGVVWVGDWRVHLFLDKIYEHQERMAKGDYRMQLATAPVVLENHFVVCPKPLNGRTRFVVLFLLLGWIGGCVLAELYDKRKALNAWLKA